MEQKQSDEIYTSEEKQNAINMNLGGNLQQLLRTSTTKLDPNKIETKILPDGEELGKLIIDKYYQVHLIL